MFVDGSSNDDVEFMIAEGFETVAIDASRRACCVTLGLHISVLRCSTPS